MIVQFSAVGQMNWEPVPLVPIENVPREGEIVAMHDGAELTVRTVIWFPFGAADHPSTIEADTPFAYVVIGPPKR